MGGGGLRILGHKKWHVWRRENIERVRRDEREHEEKQQKLRDEQRKVEQERRAQRLHCETAQVRCVSRKASGGEDAGRSSPLEHINFFKQEEEQLALAVSKGDVSSSRHSSGKRPNNGHETLAQQGRLPWYAKPAGDNAHSGGGGFYGDDASSYRKEQKRKRALDGQDPLQHMRPRRGSSSDGYEDDAQVVVPTKRSKDTEERTERVYRSDYSTLAARPAVESKQEKPFAKEKQPKSSSSSSDSKRRKKTKGKASVMEQLRREREEREHRERRRAEQLMRGT